MASAVGVSLERCHDRPRCLPDALTQWVRALRLLLSHGEAGWRCCSPSRRRTLQTAFLLLLLLLLLLFLLFLFFLLLLLLLLLLLFPVRAAVAAEVLSRGLLSLLDTPRVAVCAESAGRNALAASLHHRLLPFFFFLLLLLFSLHHHHTPIARSLPRPAPSLRAPASATLIADAAIRLD